MEYDFDLFVVGAGSAGTRLSRIAAGHGARVGVAEDRYMGGTCVNVGCVPKKLLVYAAHFAHDAADAAGFGWTEAKPGAHDWRRLIANKNAEIARLNGIYRRLIGGAGARIYDKRATFRDPHTLELRPASAPDAVPEIVTAARICIATGGWPSVPAVPGREHAITSNEAFFLPAAPRRVVVVGGGYIAVEFAGIFHGLGAEVTLVHRGALFLRGFDDDVRAFLAHEMAKQGIALRFSADVARIEAAGAAKRVTLKDGTAIDADLVMYATGRVPNTKGLGLDRAGVQLDADGAVIVDEQWRSNVPHIYAVGDVIDRVQLTPVAIAEGHALADLLFKPSNRRVSYDWIPSAVFSQPAIGTCGLTEAAARARFGAASVEIFRAAFTPMKHTLSGRDEQSLMKLVVERGSSPGGGRVVGLHMVGPEAGEIVQGFAVAMKMGAAKADFDATIGIHPTAAEEFVTMRMPAAGAWAPPAPRQAKAAG
jgi:glutathione reductase (NADPH)